MFEAWGRALYGARRLTLGIAVLFVAFAAIWGTGVFGKLTSSNNFTPSDSQSQRAANAADQAFGRDEADVVVLYRSAAMTVADPRYRQAVTTALQGLPRADVAKAETYWSTGNRNLVSADRHSTYAVLQLRGADDAARRKSYNAIKAELAAPPGAGTGALSARAGGTVPMEVAINKEVTANIGRAEAFSMPVLLILLALIFGSLAAAALPLAVGALAILGSFTVLRLLTLGTSVSTYSVNITTILGLGLGIDYGLFMVTRFREELRRQPTVERAVARTVATAGRTVAVSGVTVAVALTSLMLFPEVFLRSMGYGGVATVGVDVIAALTVLPALLAVLGHRVNALRLRRSVGGPPKDEASGAWYRLAHSVMRRPVAYVGVIVIALLALGAPFLRISWGGVDARTLPSGSVVRQVSDALNSQFPANSTAPIEAVVTLPSSAAANGTTAPAPAARQAALGGYLHRIEAIPGVTGAQVTGAQVTGGNGRVVRVDVGYAPATVSPAARHIVTEVRAVAPPPGATVLVGGQTAQLADELSSLGATLPWMALLVGLATFVLLFLAFSSVVLPLKAIVMNVLSLSATFGVIVWVFQWGHLSRALQFTPTGSIDPTIPILLAAIVFGLSMDYEVFLLSRVRELYDITADNTAAVAGGLQRTGGLITSLAGLLIIVVGAFSASGITFIKLLGVGMIVALLVDASVVRVLLVPATMRLLGRANWWAPGPLRRLYARYGISEEERRPTPVVAAGTG
ncbi:MAG: MMPL family transporter [Streptosporangiaceae bacterium]|nr:MMPL family transporter [Streptosporangiaceae bacterium]MBV9852988.1 MMPL family transporter [Streptosporangiaceae bacterium]